jgi:hypothetical protein
MFMGYKIPDTKRWVSATATDNIDLIDRRWHDLFLHHREALSAVARILTDGPCSSAVILFNAESNIKSRQVVEGFRYQYLIRSVVLAALVMPCLEECPDGFDLFDCGTADLAYFEDRLQALPHRERCVVFLRDVLEYSRRDTALLLSTSDTQVDDLHYFGRNRLFFQGPALLERVKPYFAASQPSSCNSTKDTHCLAMREAQMR